MAATMREEKRGDSDARERIDGAVQMRGTTSTGWASMPQDHVQAISSFLSLRELMLASRVCGGWRDRISRVAVRSDAIQCHHTDIATLVQSPLVRHVTALDLVSDDADGLTAVTVALTPTELATMQLVMTRLNKLKCGVKLQPESQNHNEDITFPPVATLEVTLMVDTDRFTREECWCRVRHAMAAIAAIPTLTKLKMVIAQPNGSGDSSFSMYPDSMPDGTLDSLLPLSGRLTSLAFGWRIAGPNWEPHEWSTIQLAIIRRFTRLTELDFGQWYWSTRELNDFLCVEDGDDSSVMPHLTDLHLYHTRILPEMSAALARVTSFIRFAPKQIRLPDPAFLAAYTQLESCHLYCATIVDADLLVAALSHCTRINDFGLAHQTMTDDQLELVLSRMPNLTALGLSFMRSVTSLRFASRLPHLASRLVDFTLELCGLIHPIELVSLHSLRALESLRLLDSFPYPLSQRELACFEPNSNSPQVESESAGHTRRIFPHLTHFEYRPGIVGGFGNFAPISRPW